MTIGLLRPLYAAAVLCILRATCIRPQRCGNVNSPHGLAEGGLASGEHEAAFGHDAVGDDAAALDIFGQEGFGQRSVAQGVGCDRGELLPACRPRRRACWNFQRVGRIWELPELLERRLIRLFPIAVVGP